MVRLLVSIWRHSADLGYHTEINLHDVPNRAYMLKLFVEKEERDLQKTGDRTWTPAEHQYAFVSSLQTSSDGHALTEMFHQFPKCARRSK